MFSWTTIRAICLVLLLIPIVHLAYLVSQDTLASLDGSPDAWANEIDAYARQDRASQLPENPIVVVGGRRVKLWQGLEDSLSPRPVLMRGVGDVIVDDILFHHERLIGYYQPETVIFLPGNSEFHIRDNKTAEDLVEGVRKLVELDDVLNVTRHYYVITPLKTPLYPSDHKAIDEATVQLKEWAAGNPRVKILDANRVLQDHDGELRPAFFRADGVNLNEHGYLRLTSLVQQQVEQQAE